MLPGSKGVNDIIKDKTGKLWFAGDGGISCYTPLPDKQAAPGTNEKLFTVFTGKDGQPFKNVRSVAEDKTGNIWIATESGLIRYNPFTASFTGLIADPVCYMLEDKKGSINSKQKKYK